MSNSEHEAARRVPEAAVLVAVLLPGSLLVFLLAVSPAAFLDPAFSTSVLAAVVVLSYPFLTYAVLFDDDPTTVFFPRAVAGVGIALGGLAAAIGGIGRVAWTPLLALAAALPPVAYRVGYGASRTPIPPWAVITSAATVVVVDALAATAGRLPLAVAGTTAAVVGASSGAYDRYATGLRAVDDPVLVGVAVVVAATVVIGSVRHGDAGATVALLIAGTAVGSGIAGAVLVDRYSRSRR